MANKMQPGKTRVVVHDEDGKPREEYLVPAGAIFSEDRFKNNRADHREITTDVYVAEDQAGVARLVADFPPRGPLVEGPVGCSSHGRHANLHVDSASGKGPQTLTDLIMIHVGNAGQHDGHQVYLIDEILVLPETRELQNMIKSDNAKMPNRFRTAFLEATAKMQAIMDHKRQNNLLTEGGANHCNDPEFD